MLFYEFSSVLGLHVCVICINMHHTSCCMFLHPVLASNACFLQRVHVEKWSGKRFPEPKNVVLSGVAGGGPLLRAVVLKLAVLVWM